MSLMAAVTSTQRSAWILQVTANESHKPGHKARLRSTLSHSSWQKSFQNNSI